MIYTVVVVGSGLFLITLFQLTAGPVRRYRRKLQKRRAEEALELRTRIAIERINMITDATQQALEQTANAQRRQ
jgi:hypothetical protein